MKWLAPRGLPELLLKPSRTCLVLRAPPLPAPTFSSIMAGKWVAVVNTFANMLLVRSYNKDTPSFSLLGLRMSWASGNEVFVTHGKSKC